MFVEPASLPVVLETSASDTLFRKLVGTHKLHCKTIRYLRCRCIRASSTSKTLYEGLCSAANFCFLLSTACRPGSLAEALTARAGVAAPGLLRLITARQTPDGAGQRRRHRTRPWTRPYMRAEEQTPCTQSGLQSSCDQGHDRALYAVYSETPVLRLSQRNRSVAFRHSVVRRVS